MKGNVVRIQPEEIANSVDPLPPEVVVFCGAGVSYASGPPLANELKLALLRKLSEKHKIARGLWREKHKEWTDDCLSVMLESFLEIVIRYRPEMERLLAPMFLGGRPTNYHQVLAQLLARKRLAAVITTNFDDLIERAYRAIQATHNEIPELGVFVDTAPPSSFNRPILVKLHGCATQPASMSFTMSRVGKGLEEWKVRFLEVSSTSNVYVFVGYSDRDKDISPVLSKVTNRWVWFLHDSSEPEVHITSGSILDVMLSQSNRLAVHSDTERAFPRLFFDGDGSERYASPISECDEVHPWLEHLDSLMDALTTWEKLAILGDIVYELLGDWETAGALYSAGLQQLDLPDECSVRLRLQLSGVYGDRWQIDELESNLKIASQLLGSLPTVSPKLRSMFVRNQAALCHKNALELSRRSEKLYKEAEKIHREEGELADAALMRMNRAVIMQKRGLYVQAEPHYMAALNELKTTGHLPYLAKAYVNYGSLLGMTGRNDEALKAYQ